MECCIQVGCYRHIGGHIGTVQACNFLLNDGLVITLVIIANRLFEAIRGVEHTAFERLWLRKVNHPRLWWA